MNNDPSFTAIVDHFGDLANHQLSKISVIFINAQAACNSASRIDDHKINVVADQQLQLFYVTPLRKIKGLAKKPILSNLKPRMDSLFAIPIALTRRLKVLLPQAEGLTEHL